MNSQATTRRCENCGQPVLQSDIECWHCGVKLKHPEPEPISEVEESQEEVGAGVPSLQVLFYAVMTASIALALLFVVRSLGQRPRLIAGFETDGAMAVELIAPDGSFSIEAPSQLIWYFPQAKRGQGDAAAQMVNDPQFRAALQPWHDLAPDVQILLLAQAESAILTVARSEQLGQLAVSNVVSSLANEPFPSGAVLATTKGNNRAGSTVAVITLEQEDPPMLCRQQFLPAPEGAYLAAICSDPERFDDQSIVFDAILNSLTIR